jgi:nucleoside-diphosphate-sugar epimerase
VQESICFLYPDGGGDWLDEDVPPDDYATASAALAAEGNIARFTEAGGTGVVLRFGWFYGPGAAHSDELIGYARRHLAPVMGRANGYVSSIHLADAAAAVVAALDAPAGLYNVVDDEPVTKRAHADALAAAVGVKPWLHLPGRLALALGDRTTALTRSLRVSNARFGAASGWSPRYPSVREGWPATVSCSGA